LELLTVLIAVLTGYKGMIYYGYESGVSSRMSPDKNFFRFRVDHAVASHFFFLILLILLAAIFPPFIFLSVVIFSSYLDVFSFFSVDFSPVISKILSKSLGARAPPFWTDPIYS
jgi:hypothetical protein